MRYIQGESRDQGSLFPVSLDELVAVDHVVRVLEAYVARLDLLQLGFTHSAPAATGRPAYDPADLLKLYLYGYLHRIRSSRRLEAECQRNVEVMWLLGRLAPDFKTIADFRRDNGDAFTATCRGFVQFSRQVGLLCGELVAIDGSKFQAASSTRAQHMHKALAAQQAKVEQQIAHYLQQLDEADQSETPELIDRTAVKEALAALQGEVLAAPATAVEPEARLMRSPGGNRAGYNVQSAVDSAHGLILHHEVTQSANDTQQLEPMAKAAQQVLAQESLVVVADAGYSNGEQFAACEQAGITPYVALNRGTNNQGSGEQWGLGAFHYEESKDRYVCPAGKELRLKQRNKGSRVYAARPQDCAQCPLKERCTQADRRYLTRHPHEAAFMRMERRLAEEPGMMRKRSAIAEHPFGNLKHWILGNGGRFLLRHLKGARTEMALAVQAYNLKRAINVLGPRNMIRLLT
jgi:transposase